MMKSQGKVYTVQQPRKKMKMIVAYNSRKRKGIFMSVKLYEMHSQQEYIYTLKK